MKPGRYTHLVPRYIDGQPSLRAIFNKVRVEPGQAKVGDNDILGDFEGTYKY